MADHVLRHAPSGQAAGRRARPLPWTSRAVQQLRSPSRRTLLAVVGLGVAGISVGRAVTSDARSRAHVATGGGTGTSGTAVTPSATSSTAAVVPTLDPATALWREEFDGTEGSGPDTGVWHAETGAGGWGNGELQCYTASPDNVSLDGQGNLRITAQAQAVVDASGNKAAYTSARIMTKRAYPVGRLEARISLPRGSGLWPAFWTLGENWYTAGWPMSGEVDIAEGWDDIASLATVAHAALLDGEGKPTWQQWTADTRTPAAGGSWADGFHVYAADFTADSITFSVDGTVVSEVLRSGLSSDQDWPFDQAQYCVLNIAVHGGDETGQVLTAPASMLVDYVRAYPRSS